MNWEELALTILLFTQATAGNSTIFIGSPISLATFSSGLEIKLSTVPFSTRKNGAEKTRAQYNPICHFVCLPVKPENMGSTSSGSENNQKGGRLH